MKLTNIKAITAGLAFAGLTALSIVPVHAEGRMCKEHAMHHGKITAEEMHKMMEKRMQHLHDKLSLSAPQEPSWKEFKDGMKPPGDDKLPDFDAIEKLPAPDRMARKLEMMKEHQTFMESRIPVVKKFYDGLNPEQRKAFDAEFMHFGPSHHMHHEKPAHA
jgi:protein CpxP